MSHDRNRDVVIGPSDEDLCWYMGLGDSGEPCDGDNSPKGCVPYDRFKKKKSGATAVIAERAPVNGGESAPAYHLTLGVLI